MWDPNAVVASFSSPVVVVIGLFVAIAPLSTNIAANVVSPANDFSNIAPRRSASAPAATSPRDRLRVVAVEARPNNYVFGWLNGYGSAARPIGGIMVADYWILRKRVLVVDDLYRVPRAATGSPALQRPRARGGRDRGGPGDPRVPRRGDDGGRRGRRPELPRPVLTATACSSRSGWPRSRTTCSPRPRRARRERPRWRRRTEAAHLGTSPAGSAACPSRQRRSPRPAPTWWRCRS